MYDSCFLRAIFFMHIQKKKALRFHIQYTCVGVFYHNQMLSKNNIFEHTAIRKYDDVID